MGKVTMMTIMTMFLLSSEEKRKRVRLVRKKAERFWTNIVIIVTSGWNPDWCHQMR